MAVKPHHYAFMAALLARQRSDAAAIRRLQTTRLRRLLRNAVGEVPYYRELTRGLGLKPEDIRGPEDWPALPLIDKLTLNSLGREQTTSSAVDLRRCLSYSTSGTTGIPLTTYLLPEDAARHHQGWARSYLAGGMKPWDKTAALIGSRTVRPGPSWYERLGFWRRYEISAWDDPKEWVRSLRRWKPRVLLGYAANLNLLVEAFRASGSAAGHPEIVFHTSGILDPRSRREIAAGLEARILDIYGSSEGGCLAWECLPCGGYHMAQDMALIEVLRDGRPAVPGETGEVVITPFYGRAMPLLRYRQGDLVTLSRKEPVCGCRFPLLENIDGRVCDLIRLPGGRTIPPTSIYHTLDPWPGLRRWRVTQAPADLLVAEIEAAPGFTGSGAREIEAALRSLIGSEAALEVRIVERIPLQPGEKFRAVRGWPVPG
jgi:phenylacetate-CoA ligase